MDDLTDYQLSPGIPNPHLPFTNIGRPQIAIMTISGNDVGFEVALNDCIMQVWRPKDCNTTLDSIEASIRAPNFNDIEAGCDNVSWAFWSDKTKLTTYIRGWMNSLVRQSNTVLKEATMEVKHLGVFYVDGFNQQFDGHRFCEAVTEASMYILKAGLRAQAFSKEGDDTICLCLLYSSLVSIELVTLTIF
ncbi:hypothetical protein V8E54_013664 [Elaphomyces granulatus]